MRLVGRLLVVLGMGLVLLGLVLLVLLGMGLVGRLLVVLGMGLVGWLGHGLVSTVAGVVGVARLVVMRIVFLSIHGATVEANHTAARNGGAFFVEGD